MDSEINKMRQQKITTVMLVACLVEHGHVNEPEFLRLMSGE